MENLLVSVIIPTYKRQPNMLKRAVLSVINQSYQNIEVIVVDDSPTDFEFRSEVEKMLNSLDKRIRYIKHDTNMGACAARNTGINASCGEFIAFLDDDDEWLHNKLEKQLKKIVLFKETGLIYCREYIVNENTGNIQISTRKCHAGYVFDNLIISNFIGSTSFVLAKKECFKKVGLFNTQLESAQDYDMWLRISQKYIVDFVNEPLVNYYVHNEGRISDNTKKKIQGLEMLIQLYSEYLEKNKRVKGIRLIKLVPYYLSNKDKEKAWKTYIEAIKLSPFSLINNLRYLKCFL